jgi:hypothetical protein
LGLALHRCTLSSSSSFVFGINYFNLPSYCQLYLFLSIIHRHQYHVCNDDNSHILLCLQITSIKEYKWQILCFLLYSFSV